MGGSLFYTIFLIYSVTAAKEFKNEEKNNPAYYKIGGVLSGNASEKAFQEAIKVCLLENSCYLREFKNR